MKSWAMVRFTMFEAARRGTLIFYFVVGSFIIAAFAIWLKRSPVDPNAIILFGGLMPEIVRGGITNVEFLLLAHFRQSTSAIILLGTFASAGLMNSFLEKGTIELYLTKPLTRSELFLSRASGATMGVSANIIYYIVGIWIVFGLKLGVWHSGFLATALLVSLAFACYYSIVAFVGVWTRSAIFAIIFGLIFSFVSVGLELREKGMYKIWNNEIYHRALDVLYYVTPQLDGMLTNASRLIGHMPGIEEATPFSFMPFVYSIGSAALYYVLSIRYFSRQDF
jgi:ABC-type transport system involved in multi-copper enzyme maturation permease subunit